MTFTQLTKRVFDGARCKGRPVNEWFPYEPPQDRDVARVAYEKTARELCSGCPVIADCLERALRIEAQPRVPYIGIFGGKAPWERKAINRSRRRAAHAARVRADAAEVSA
jgi:hypothetical protein